LIACFGTTDGLRIYDHDGNLLHHLGKDSTWTSGVFSRDEKTFAAGQTQNQAEYCACVWDVESGDIIQSLPHPDAVYSVQFSPDRNYLLTACRDGQARVFEWKSGKLMGVATHDDEVHCADFLDGQDLIVTGSRDGACRIWDWRTGAQVTSKSIAGLDGPIYDMEIGKDIISLFGKKNYSLAIQTPKGSSAESIDFFQWCTGSRWHSVDQSPVVLTSKQWMELWQQRPKRYVKQEALLRSNHQLLSPALRHLEGIVDPATLKSPTVIHQYSELITALSDRNPFFDASSIAPEFEDGKLVALAISCRLKDLSPISKLKDLKAIDLQGSKFEGDGADISCLRELTNLESFLCMSKIRDLSPLSKLPLKRLNIWVHGHADLSPLSGLQLRDLNCGGHHALVDLSPLKGMPLESLCINLTSVSDLSPLKGMPLKDLGLADTKVTDLSPLDGMQIETLGINAGTKIRDLNQIRQFPLKALHIDEPEKHRELINSLPNLQSLNSKPIAEFN